MASDTQNAKKRQAKATQQQVDYMVDYFIEHPHVATGKFTTMHGKADLRGSWDQLAEQLNRMGKDGRVKDVKSWKSTWRDNKTSVSQKVAKIRMNRTKTGNVGGPPLKLSQREEKILGLMGFDYVEEVECPDSFPEEMPNAIEMLTEGEDDVLQIDADVLTVRENRNALDLSFTDFETLEDGEEEVNTNSQEIRVSILNNGPETPIVGSSNSGPNEAPIGGLVTRNGDQTPRGKRAGKRTDQRLGTQLEKAREDFVSLAERQIVCIEMFARAMQQIANNDRDRNEILRTFIAAETTKEKRMTELAVMMKDCVEILKKQ